VRLLKERKHILTLQQLDQMVDKQEKFRTKQEGGEDVGLCDAVNLVPVEDAGVSVSVVGVYRDVEYQYNCKWDIRVFRLKDSWLKVDRLVLGSSDASRP
jgi:hypothetical protein